MKFAQADLDRMMALFLPKVFRGFWSIVWLIVLAGVAIAAGWLLMPEWREGQRLGMLVGGAVGGSLVLLALCYVIARSRMLRLYRPILRAKAEGAVLGEAAIKQAEEARERQRTELARGSGPLDATMTPEADTELHGEAR